MWHRNRLSQMLVEKEDSDRLLLASNRDIWYSVDLSYVDPEVRSTFHPFYYDQDTDNFINISTINSNNLCFQVYLVVFYKILSICKFLLL